MELSVHWLTGSLPTHAIFKTSMKKQLSKLVVTFSLRALQPTLCNLCLAAPPQTFHFDTLILINTSFDIP